MQSLYRVFEQLVHERNPDRRPDPSHPHRRRFTAKYRRKRGIVKNLWICSGLLMLGLGASLELVLGLGLTTTFAAFCILDETP